MECGVKRDRRGTNIEFAAELDVGMPRLADMLDPVVESALRANITSILVGLPGSGGLVESAECS
jgi:hypothetical protein